MNKIIFELTALLWMVHRATFYRDLADAFRRVVGLRDFLEREMSNARLLKDSMRHTIMRALSVRYASGHGTNLQDLMRGIAPQSDQMLLAAVDYAGNNKPEALDKAAAAVEFQLKSLRVLAINLAMPAVAVPIVGALCVITAGIITSIAASAPASVWQGFNGQVRWLAEVINNYSAQLAIGLLVFIAVIVRIMPRWIGPYRLIADNWPGFSLYRDFQSAIVLSTLAMMLSSGKTLRQAVEDMLPTASRWLRWQLQRILNSLEDNPNDYVAAFSKGLMPMTVRARIATLLDSSKSFDQVLVTLGSTEVDRLGKTVEISAKSVNGALTGFLVVIAVILSIGQMTIASALSSAADPSKLMRHK